MLLDSTVATMAPWFSRPPRPPVPVPVPCLVVFIVSRARGTQRPISWVDIQ